MPEAGSAGMGSPLHSHDPAGVIRDLFAERIVRYGLRVYPGLMTPESFTSSRQRRLPARGARDPHSWWRTVFSVGESRTFLQTQFNIVPF
jgi:hypothetical protein